MIKLIKRFVKCWKQSKIDHKMHLMPLKTLETDARTIVVSSAMEIDSEEWKSGSFRDCVRRSLHKEIGIQIMELGSLGLLKLSVGSVSGHLTSPGKLIVTQQVRVVQSLSKRKEVK